MKLLGKVAIVTGSASGIGRAIAEKFAAEGAKVILADINEDGGSQTVAAIRGAGGEATFIRTDVSVADDCKRMVDLAVEKYGGLDILSNNAAVVIPRRPLVDTTEDEWDRTMAVTLKGVFLGCKYALPAMIARGGGVVVNTASIAGIVATPTFAAYCAAKGGVVQLTKSIACDYGRNGIRANAICPGIVETPATAGLLADPQYREWQLGQTLLKRIGTPDEIANAALFLASDDSSYMTGSLLVVDAGKTAV